MSSSRVTQEVEHSAPTLLVVGLIISGYDIISLHFIIAWRLFGAEIISAAPSFKLGNMQDKVII